ncbi:MAG: CNNM domain-containing protein [Gammaproteobacteria bacterium]|nr:CNNM domain-containing protein [Gammaproteobacteria bacterium]
METFVVPAWVLILAVFILLLMSAFFAGAETAMMKLNVYRMRALVRKRHGGARRAYRLLQHKDRLLGVILIGNNLVNYSAAVVANVVFVRWFGTELGGVITTVSITFIFLIFADIAPKTIGAVRPESIAYPSAYVLLPLQSIMKYLVSFSNFCGAFVVKPFTRGVVDDEDLTEDELRQVFDQARKLPRNRQLMILNILSLEEQTVGDVMQPREAIYGIDLNESMSEIRQRIAAAGHTRLPAYRSTINDIQGILHMREANRLMQNPDATKEDLIAVLENTYYTPSQVPLSRLVNNFKQRRRRFSIAVDEYGVVVGLITIDDIIEEIVGEFTLSSHETDTGVITPIDDSTYRVTGNTLLHELNNTAHWTLPEDGPRTVNGWVLDHLRRVPSGQTSITIENYRVEIIEIVDNAIKSATITQLPFDDDFGVERQKQEGHGEQSRD